MGLTTWKDAPDEKIQKFDVSIAKNYLTDAELAQLQRLVNACLDIAEDMAPRKIPITMADWEERLNRFIVATDCEILQDAGESGKEIRSKRRAGVMKEPEWQCSGHSRRQIQSGPFSFPLIPG